MWAKYFLHFQISKKGEGFILIEKKKIKKKNPLQVTFNWVLWYIRYQWINPWGWVMKPAFYLLPKFAAYRKCLIAQAQWQKQYNSRWSTPFGEYTVAAIKRKKYSKQLNTDPAYPDGLFWEKNLKLINRSPRRSPKIMVFQKRRGMAVVRKQRQQNFLCLELKVL